MSDWYVGQQVYCLRFGEGVVIATDKTHSYPITVQFTHGITHYTRDGKFHYGDANHLLYPAKPEIIAPKWQPKPGEWCWFWDDIKAESVLRKFSIMNGNRFECNLGWRWLNCAPFIGELPPHLKEVQP